MIIPVLLPACSGPLSMLDPAGPGAREAATLWWGIFAFFTLVYLGVVIAWFYALRRNDGSHDSGLGSTGHPDNEHRLHQGLIIGGGIILPVIAMFALLIPGAPAGNRMAGTHLSAEQALHLQITGHQWWWEVRYPATNDGPAFTLRNELHIPAGTPIRLSLESADVIHSLWIPRLAHKMDLVPGRVNELFVQADEPGIYPGVCAEFCGLAHAHMTLELHAHTPQDFARWQVEQANGPDEAER